MKSNVSVLKPAEIGATEKLGKKSHNNTHLAHLAEAKLCQLSHQPK